MPYKLQQPQLQHRKKNPLAQEFHHLADSSKLDPPLHKEQHEEEEEEIQLIAMPAAKAPFTRVDRAPPPAASSLAGSSNSSNNNLDPHLGSKNNALPDAAAPPLSLTQAALTQTLRSSAGRRCGPSTPAPAWKLFEDPFYDAMVAASAQHNQRPQAPAASSRRTTVSARKLAATLWESQEISHSRDAAAHKTTEATSALKEKEAQRKQQQSTELLVTSNGEKSGGDFVHSPSPAPSYVSQRLRRRSSLQQKFGDSFRRNPPSSGQIPSAHSQVLRLLDRSAGVSPANNGNEDSSEIEADGRPVTPSLDGPRKIDQGPATSGELLKVLNRIWTLEEQHNSSMSVVTALNADLEKARVHVEELTAERKSHCEHIENLTKELANEKAMWQEREKEAIRVAVLSITKDLEDERKSKRKLDLVYKKGAKELLDVKKSLDKALQDLQREQKARELMEDVCDELAREIGEDRAQVEELKRESAKVREEVEEERKMLQMAEVWREERVHMKLAEARLQLEEKNAALDKLRSELESFLKAKRAWDARDEGSHTKTAKKSDILISSLSLPRLDNSGNDNVDPDLATVSEIHGNTRPSQELVDDDDSFDGDLRSIKFSKESLLGRFEGAQSGYTSVFQQENDGKGWFSIDRESSPVEKVSKAKIGQGNRQALERTSSSKVEAVLAAGQNRDKGGNKRDYQRDSQRIDKSLEKGESKERRGERESSVELREGLHSPWQSDNEESQSYIMMGARGKGRNLQGRGNSSLRTGGIQGEGTGSKHEAASKSDVYGNSAAWTFQSLGNSGELKASAGSLLSEQTANSTSSPTRQWGQYWSSPDPRSPRFSRAMKAPIDVPKVSRDNSLKTRLLEAKLEGQQARLRSGKGV